MMKKQMIVLTLLTLVLLAGCKSPSDSGGDEDKDPTPPPPQEDTTPPSSPSGAAGESGDTIVELSWNANSESDLAGYNLYRSEESFSNVSGMDPVNGTQLISGTTYTDEGLENGTSYYYRLTAVDTNDNQSSASAQVKVTPFADPPNRPKN